MILDKSQMTEEDIKLNFITPAILSKWQNKVTMETRITDGRVNIKGNMVTRERPKKLTISSGSTAISRLRLLRRRITTTLHPLAYSRRSHTPKCWTSRLPLAPMATDSASMTF